MRQLNPVQVFVCQFSQWITSILWVSAASRDTEWGVGILPGGAQCLCGSHWLGIAFLYSGCTALRELRVLVSGALGRIFMCSMQTVAGSKYE